MSDPAPSLAAVYSKLCDQQDRSLLWISIFIQLVLGLFFGHAYDQRIFMATGYLVGSGQNPYLSQDLTAVFHNDLFQGMTSIGYPPPWPLVVALIYKSVYNAVPNLLIYNLALKLPVIIANLCLAYLAAAILKDLGAGSEKARRARLFLLFNPLLLYATAAWGQFDSLVALLTLISLVLLDAGKPDLSALLLALSLAFKPTALPVVLVALVYALGQSLARALRYMLVLAAGLLGLCIAPFLLFGWDPSPILRHWNAHFTVGGGLSVFSFYEILKDGYLLPGDWWLVSLAWLPILGIAALLVLRQGVAGLRELLRKSAALILVFFLTRTWLSEPNIVLLLPFLVILVALGDLHPLLLAILWISPLVFTIFNTSPPQLLFPTFPGAMQRILRWSDEYRSLRLLLRTLSVIPWQIAGWWAVVDCMRPPRLSRFAKLKPEPDQTFLEQA
jgi:hypothetical protein